MTDVTVVLVTYNRIEMLKRSLASILSQEDVSFDIKIIDNGSNDGTREWMATLPSSIKITQREGNDITTLLSPIQEIQGRHIALFADDDLMLPGCLAKKVAALDSNPSLGMVYSRCRHMDVNGKDLGIYHIGLNSDKDILDGAATFETLFLAQYISMPSVMFRTEAFKQIVQYSWDERFQPSADWIMLLQTLFRGWHVAHLHKPTVSIRIHPGQDSNIRGYSGGFSKSQLAIWRYWIEEYNYQPSRQDWSTMLKNLFDASPKELLAQNLDEFEALKPQPEFHPI